MAENDKSISQFDLSSSLPVGSLFIASIEDQTAASGYISKKVTSETAASEMLGQYGFPLILTKTSSKNVLGALNEIAYKTLTGTLTAGQTSVTISDASITTTSDIDIYSDVYGVAPEDVTVSTGSITLTFEVRQTDLHIKLRVS